MNSTDPSPDGPTRQRDGKDIAMQITRPILLFLALFPLNVSCSDSNNANGAGDKTQPACPDSYSEAKDWTAVDNQEPPGRSFYVTGKVTVPTLGYTVELKKRSPQGINPGILLLDLTVKKPAGPAGGAITTETPRYEEKPYAGKYTSVELYCGNNTIATPPIKVVN